MSATPCDCCKSAWAATHQRAPRTSQAAAVRQPARCCRGNSSSPAASSSSSSSSSSSRRGRLGGSGEVSRTLTCSAADGSNGSNRSVDSSQPPRSVAFPAAAEQGSVVAHTGWHPLDSPSIWKGTEEQAVFRQATPYPLSPTWKVILLSDGSVTRHLQLMTNQRVEVECLEMRDIGHERAGLPAAASQIDGPLVQRQVLLHIPDPHGKAYVYATSWWNADTVDQYLQDRSKPIWVSLSQGRTELYRDILQLELGHCPYLEGRFQAEGPFWGRQYLFWHGGKPLTLIYEVFSTALDEFLGPPQQAQSSNSSSSGSSSSSPQQAENSSSSGP